jgi:ABC-type spermidine/putrescine transport system permease subunit II
LPWRKGIDAQKYRTKNASPTFCGIKSRTALFKDGGNIMDGILKSLVVALMTILIACIPGMNATSRWIQD